MEELRKQVIKLQGRIHDLMDKPSHPSAIRLKTEVQGLEDDLQVRKKPLTIEDRIKGIIRILEEEAKEARIMNYEHLDLFRKQFEGLRESIKRLT
jgi:hypothetical protein